MRDRVQHHAHNLSGRRQVLQSGNFGLASAGNIDCCRNEATENYLISQARQWVADFPSFDLNGIS